MDLKTLVERHDTPAGKAFDLSIQALIILSLFTFSMETLPNLDPQVRQILVYFETITVILFTIEYALRLYVADRRISYIFSFYGIVDLLAIVPFYLALGIDLRSLRAMRLLRLFRLFKLVRYNNAIERFVRAFSIAREEIIVFAMVTIILLYLSAIGIYYFEHEAQPEIFASIFHSMWWAVTTLTTVGYGDMYPITAGGRIFTFSILILGLGIVAIPAGLLASALNKVRQEDEDVDPDE
ncbi:MAG: ion transporter [Gammaproteobacteria bacterium]